MLRYREGQQLMKLVSQSVYGSKWEHVLNGPSECEKQMDQFMINYTKSVIATEGIERAKEFVGDEMKLYGIKK